MSKVTSEQNGVKDAMEFFGPDVSHVPDNEEGRSKAVRYGFILASEVTRLAALTPKWDTMDTRPLDTAILVWLENPHMGSIVVSARFGKNVSIVGGYFAFDMPKPLFWMPLPTPPQQD